MVETKRKYLLKFHRVYSEKVHALKLEIQKLKTSLEREQFLHHPDVKFAARLREATEKIIPEDPDRKEYQLHGVLKKYRRYKQGLQRYRLFFAFSTIPPVILYLYVNDKSSLRRRRQERSLRNFCKISRTKKSFS